ncbi:hypothetical protein HBI14_227030 [Parastagonospora nodorum]|nr:hypothetical protein HBI14_227030 [Parastagonospora nodorum]
MRKVFAIGVRGSVRVWRVVEGEALVSVDTVSNAGIEVASEAGLSEMGATAGRRGNLCRCICKTFRDERWGLELVPRLSSVLPGAFQVCSNWQADSGSSKASSRVKSLSQESVFPTRLRELIARPEIRTRAVALRALAFMRDTFVVPNDMNVTLTRRLQRRNCPWEK